MPPRKCRKTCPNLVKWVSAGFVKRVYYWCNLPWHYGTCGNENQLPVCPASCLRNHDWTVHYDAGFDEQQKEIGLVNEFLQSVIFQSNYTSLALSLDLPSTLVVDYCSYYGIKRTRGRPNNQMCMKVRFQHDELLRLHGVSRAQVIRVIKEWETNDSI